ncbi:nucleolar MIF4G domain-containing protein 1-like [Aplochiton taeniatus]
MKGQSKLKKKRGKKDTGKLQKYMESVGEYVKGKVGCEEVEDSPGLRFVKKKSRKELRKEKRKLKKAKITNLDGKKILKPSDSKDAEASEQTQQLQKQNDERRETAKKDGTQNLQVNPTQTVVQQPEHSRTQLVSKKRKKKNKLQESRKKALLEANVAEDREIKKLERYLGFNKRKNKKNLPQSFVADGLDYILGVLDPGSSASNVYDSDDDVNLAKENFEKLGNSGSEISEEEETEPLDNCTDKSNEDVSDEDIITEMSDESNNEQEEAEEIEEQSDSDAADAVKESMNEETKGSNTETPESKQTDTSLAGKYVPPHLRHSGDDKRKAELERLKRNVKGLVNR